MSKIFLYRDNTNERDCCAYIEVPHFECNHYFSGIRKCGACYSGGTFADYEEIETILSEEEYKTLIDLDRKIHDLGYGIKKGDDRYQKGMKLCKEVQKIIDKLQSEEAEEFFEKIQKDERDELCSEYNFTKEEIEEIFDNYGLEYRDRAIVGTVFDDIEEAAHEEAWQCGYTKEYDERYFNYNTFADDLLEREDVYELSTGRILFYAY